MNDFEFRQIVEIDDKNLVKINEIVKKELSFNEL